MTSTNLIALERFVQDELNSHKWRRLVTSKTGSAQPEDSDEPFTECLGQPNQLLVHDNKILGPTVLIVHKVLPQSEKQNVRRLRLISNALDRLGYLNDEQNLFAWWEAALRILDRLGVIRINPKARLSDCFDIAPIYESEQSSIVETVLKLWAEPIVRQVRTMLFLNLPRETLDLYYLHQIIIMLDNPLDILTVYSKYAPVSLGPQEIIEDDLVVNSMDRIHLALWHADHSSQMRRNLVVASRLDRVCPQIRIDYTRRLRDPEQRVLAQVNPHGHLASFIQERIRGQSS